MNKLLYKLELYLIKVIPMLIACCYLVNTILSYFNIDTVIPSIIGGMSILTWIFLYVSSFVFKFCIYHRMFLYYVFVVDVLNYIDYEYVIFDTDEEAIMINLIISGIFLFIILYFHQVAINHERRIEETSS